MQRPYDLRLPKPLPAELKRERRHTRTLCLTDSLHEKLRAIGDGIASDGLEICVRAYWKANPIEPGDGE